MNKKPDIKNKKNKSRNDKNTNHVSQVERIKSINMDDDYITYTDMPSAKNTSDDEAYDEYYDDPIYSKRNSSSRKNLIILTSSLIGAFAVLIVVLLFFIKPSGTKGTGFTGRVAAASDIETTVTANDEISDETGTSADDVPDILPDDNQAPVIYGIMPIATYQGSPISYKQGIYVVDDLDEAPVLEVDNESVDPSTPGTYYITYIARDRNGNESRETTTLTIMEGNNIVSEEEIYELADTILDFIITEDENTDALKCLKVYEYLHAIGYVDEVHSQDWMQNAYWMLSKREGDCFCYYSAARLLLTRLGYDVMEVRNNNNYVHFWCLVSIDGGETWWHFDPTCWSFGEDGILCLVSDTYLDDFAHRHKTSDGRLLHAWDRTAYPATPLEDFWTDEDRSIIYEGGLIEMNPQYAPDDDIWNENSGWDYYPVNIYFEEYYTESEEEFAEDTADIDNEGYLYPGYEEEYEYPAEDIADDYYDDYYEQEYPYYYYEDRERPEDMPFYISVDG